MGNIEYTAINTYKRREERDCWSTRGLVLVRLIHSSLGRGWCWRGCAPWLSACRSCRSCCAAEAAARRGARSARTLSSSASGASKENPLSEANMWGSCTETSEKIWSLIRETIEFNPLQTVRFVSPLVQFNLGFL